MLAVACIMTPFLEKLMMHYLLGDTVIFASHSSLLLLSAFITDGRFAYGSSSRVGYFVLPLDAYYFAKAAEMEIVFFPRIFNVQ